MDHVLHAGRVEPGDDLPPPVGLHRDRDVVQAAEHLGVRTEVEAGEVEEGEQVLVADVEEEVRRARVVAVLDQLGEREAEEALVEGDGPLDVAADQGGVVQAAGARRRALRLPARGGRSGCALARPRSRPGRLPSCPHDGRSTNFQPARPADVAGVCRNTSGKPRGSTTTCARSRGQCATSTTLSLPSGRRRASGSNPPVREVPDERPEPEPPAGREREPATTAGADPGPGRTPRAGQRRHAVSATATPGREAATGLDAASCAGSNRRGGAAGRPAAALRGQADRLHPARLRRGHGREHRRRARRGRLEHRPLSAAGA